MGFLPERASHFYWLSPWPVRGHLRPYWLAVRNEAVVKPPRRLRDYLFWQAKDLTDFKLIGANNKTLVLNDLKGKWTFIFLVIHTALMSCPLTMGILGAGVQAYREKSGCLPRDSGNFVSVDPKRDTPELLKEYASYFNSKFTGVTGKPLSWMHFPGK